MQTDEHIPKRNPFKVPDSYFESLTHSIQTECYQEQQNFRTFLQLQTLAPTLAIIAFLFIGIPHFSPSNSELNSTDLYALLEEEMMDWDESLIYEFALADESNETINYLLEEIDLSILINEL